MEEKKYTILEGKKAALKKSVLDGGGRISEFFEDKSDMIFHMFVGPLI